MYRKQKSNDINDLFNHIFWVVKNGIWANECNISRKLLIIFPSQDSEQQMILTARRSLVQKMARHQTPQIEIFFLNISGDNTAIQGQGQKFNDSVKIQDASDNLIAFYKIVSWVIMRPVLHAHHCYQKYVSWRLYFGPFNAQYRKVFKFWVKELS